MRTIDEATNHIDEVGVSIGLDFLEMLNFVIFKSRSG